MSLQLDGVPDALREIPHWVLWKPEERDGKRTKPPYTKSGTYANTRDPSTWLPFSEAVEICQTDGYSGIGFVLTDGPFTIIDLDNCVHDGTILPWAVHAVKELKSYTELSPSGRGLHIIIRGDAPTGSRKTDGFEVLGDGRYATITGNALKGYNIEPTENHQALKTLCEVMFGPAGRTAVELSRGVRGEKLRKLYLGRWQEAGGYPSQSEAEYGFCGALARIGLSRTETDQVYRMSGLFRSKWDETHSSDGRTYGEMALDKIFAETQPCPLEIRPLADVEPLEPEFLLYPWLPRRAVTFLDGDPGAGKTLFLLAIVAGLTGHLPLPPIPPPQVGWEDGTITLGSITDLAGKLATVVILTNEDELGILRGRLEKLGGAPNQVLTIGLTSTPPANRSGITGELLPDALPMLEALHPDLLVIDPITLYLTGFQGIDISDAVGVRKAMESLLNAARELGCAVLTTRHFRKTAGKALYRGLGSVDFTAMARSILTLARKPDTEEILVAHSKHNYSPQAPTVSFKVEPRGKNWEFRWTGTSDTTADELTDPQRQDSKTPRQRARRLLEDLLRRGPVPAEEVYEAAEREGISIRTLRRAFTEMGGVTTKRKDPGTNQFTGGFWSLPKGYGSKQTEEDAYE